MVCILGLIKNIYIYNNNNNIYEEGQILFPKVV